MPFIVQCPHADCRRYMLLEDEVRGTTVNCLLCAKPIRVDASGSHNAPPAGNKAPAPPPPPPPRPAPPPMAPPPVQSPGLASASQASAAKQPPPVQAPVPQPPSDEKVIVTCPNPMCKSPLRVAAASRGTNLRCPKCKQVFKV